MCGISAIISGGLDISKTLVSSLEKLEYRGYDSCGVFLHERQGKGNIRKNVGEVRKVAEMEGFSSLSGYVGLAHTRWATHGGVFQKNSHPMPSNDGKFVIVHNGMISNYKELKTMLIDNGFTFHSDTDTEVFAHLLEYLHRKTKDIEQLFTESVKMIEGHYSIVMFTEHQPDRLFAVKHDTPLVLGIGTGMNFLSSDINAFLEWTRQAVEINDDEYVVLFQDSYKIKKVDGGEPLSRVPFSVDWSIDEAKKGGYQHFMLKEIFEHPFTIKKAMHIEAEQLDRIASLFASKQRSFLLGVGTTYYIALYGSYLFSELAGLHVGYCSTDEAPDYLPLCDKDLALFLSQSGETYDTRMAVKKAIELGASTAGIVNVMGSSISQMVNDCIFQGSGPEISVVSTKAAVSQMIILHRLALRTGVITGRILKSELKATEDAMMDFCSAISDLLNEQSGAIRNLAEAYCSPNETKIKGWLYLGRNIYYPVALESALKMKEITYMSAEGMPCGFLKHGTLSMVDQSRASFFFLPSRERRSLYDSTVHALQEVKARNGVALGFASHDDEQARMLFDDCLMLPDLPAMMLPYYEIIVAQLFAYYSALVMGKNVDKPRNLAKSVTVG